MSYRSLLYFLGAALAATGCWLPWSCYASGERGFYCPAGIELSWSMQGDGSSRLVLQDSGPGSALGILLLTLVVVWLAFGAPRFVRRPHYLAFWSSAALALVCVCQLIATLAQSLHSTEPPVALPIWTATVVCTGATLMLVAGAIGLRGGRNTAPQEPAP